MEEEKNKAIMNCGDDYDDILDIQYGRKGTPSGAAGGEDRYEEVLYLPHREREDGRAAIDSLQDIPGAGQAGQHHHPVSRFPAMTCVRVSPAGV